MGALYSAYIYRATMAQKSHFFTRFKPLYHKTLKTYAYTTYGLVNCVFYTVF